MTRDLNVIVGLGATGISCARYFARKGLPFAIVDSRPNPPQAAQFKELFPNVPMSLGSFDEALLNRAKQIVLSPGIAMTEPAIAKQVALGATVVGDIELFAQEVSVPVIAITGTNAKSTVTTLVGEMAAAAGKRVQVGGNLGMPALDLLTPDAELYVLELSSFQLETTYSLKPAVATVLNVTPDHMDRYGSLEQYTLAKQHVYSHCQVAVSNLDDSLTECRDPFFSARRLYFTLNEPSEGQFGLVKKGDAMYLAFQNQILMPVTDLPILGRHYQANALAALAIGYGYGLPFAPMISTLVDFKGLPHRCQLVRELQGVRWYNDSKGTNVGATLAAIDGLGPEIQGKLILIAGGVGKNADFSPLVPAITKYVKTVVLIGEAAPVLADLLGDRVHVAFAKSMDEAISLANSAAEPKDSVLLSPACASFDMFNNFEHRGEVFAKLVSQL